MKSKYYLISSIIQLVVGILAIISFILLAVNGENVTKWILALVMAVVYIILGIVGILEHKSLKK